MEDYQEWLGKLQKRGSNPYKIEHCLGARDAFHWVRKNKWEALDGRTCDKLLYSRIISTVNKILVEKILEGHRVEFPYQLGHVLLTSTPANVRYVDGELKTNYLTDWKKTLSYMWEDEQARNNHTYVKRVQPFIYKVQYYKGKARYHNRFFYKFRPNRSIVKTMGAAVERQKMNAEPWKY